MVNSLSIKSSDAKNQELGQGKINKIVEIDHSVRSRKRSRCPDDERDDLMDTSEQWQMRKTAEVGRPHNGKKVRLLDGRIDYVTLMESRIGSRSLKNKLKFMEIKKSLENPE